MEGDSQLDKLRRDFGFDTARIWANSVRVINGPHELLLVFQEKMGVEGENTVLERNLASIVLPKSIAKELAEIIMRQPGVATGE